MATPEDIKGQALGLFDQLYDLGVADGKAQQKADDQPVIDAANQRADENGYRVVALQAEFDAYKAAHPDQPPVDPPPPPTPVDPAVVVGMNFTHTNTGQTQEALADAARIYVPAGWTNLLTLTEFKRAYGLGVRTFVLSWKDKSTATIGPMLDSAPDDCVLYGVAHHEPEDDMAPADWIALQKAHMPVVRAHGARPWAILMAWTLDPASKRTVADWVLPAGLVDGYGFDLYPTSVKGQAASVARIKAALPVLGVDKYLLGEYGVLKSDPTLGVQLIQALKPQTDDAEIRLYWSQQVSSTKPDYHFSEQTATAWFS